MAQNNLTREQQAVVDHSGSALLVSAAAGSGKTKVLVDRLLRMVCDPATECNVDDFLIITYTKAAAAELRMKIASRIRELLAEDPSNRHLRRQLTRIYQAEISTVHAFCARILRAYAHCLSLPADFRVAEESECQIIRQRALDDLLLEAYSKEEAKEDLTILFSTLGYGRDDRRLGARVLALYDCVQCHPWPDKWTANCYEHLSLKPGETIQSTVWGAYLLKEMESFLDEQISRMSYALECLNQSASLSAYIPTFRQNIEMLSTLREDISWDALQSARVSFGSLKAVRNCTEVSLQNEVKNIRDNCKKQLEKYMRYFTAPGDLALQELESTFPALKALLRLTERFSQLYRDRKRKRRILDFSDLEHESIRLLVDPYTGEPTRSAREISARFREIMVDEYQDSNLVQDTIFRAISKGEKNLFMVGDVKQSIYRFRLAEPEIFLEKYGRYQLREQGDGEVGRKILLSANFRSRPEILEAVNHVFTTVMSQSVGDLDYGDAERLRTIREFPPVTEPMVELHLLDTETEDEESPSKTEAEARFVAQKICELIHGEHYITDGETSRRIQQEDIAILMRSVSNTAPVYARVLGEAGLTVAADGGEDLFSTAEVSGLMAMLNIMDNPHQDVPLLTVLAGPIGNFSADDLAHIRSCAHGTDLYDALVRASQSDEKAGSFLQLLSHLRERRRHMDLLELIDYVVEKTEMRNIFAVMPDAERRLSHLRSFYDLCAGAAKMEITSLSGLLRYLTALRKQEQKIPAQMQSSGGVTLMSVHKSKGLEFPVVFLCDTSRKFNFDSLSEPVLTDQELLMACDVFDRPHRLRYPSTAKFAIAAKKRREMISEELRVLYVAMTRARERLYMVYCGNKLTSQLQNMAVQASYPAQRCVAGGVAQPGQWLLLAAAVRPEASHLFGGAKEIPHKPEFAWRVEYHLARDTLAVSRQGRLTHGTDSPETPDVATMRCLRDLATPSDGAGIPAKLTATQLKGRTLDQESAEEADITVTNQRSRIHPRKLMRSAGELSPTQKGTATHLFMQYCRFDNLCDEAWLQAEKERLLQGKYLSAEQIKAVNDTSVLQFFGSDLGKLVTGTQEIQREFKFSLLVDAQEYYRTACREKIMLQGVVDCIVFTPDGLIVLDYKTDKLRPGEEQQRAELYRPQLETYSLALERIFQRPVLRKVLYFFETATSFDVI